MDWFDELNIRSRDHPSNKPNVLDRVMNSDDWNELVSKFKSKDDLCRTILGNQIRWLEDQIKALNKYDPETEYAMEAAGDIIRELAKGCTKGYEDWGPDWGYISKKIGRVESVRDEWHRRRL